jgi:hypothetical protein
MDRLYQLVATAVAIACFFVALPARATLAGECVAELASLVPTSLAPEGPVLDGDGEAWLMCDGEMVPVKEVSHREIPMCSGDATSAVAPLVIHPVDGASAEAVANCKRFDGPDEWARGGDDQRVQVDTTFQLHAAACAAPAPAARVAPMTTMALYDDGAARRGFDSDVFRPPRS